jgi:cold shock protein
LPEQSALRFVNGDALAVLTILPHIRHAIALNSTFCSLAASVCDRDVTEPGHRKTWVADKTGDITMANGTVKWFNSTKGFGFIAPANGGKDVFVHISAMERAGIRALPDGQAVTFDIEAGRDGRESAINLALA